MSVTWRIHTAVANNRAEEIRAFLLGIGDKVQLISGHWDLDSAQDLPDKNEVAGIAITTLDDAVHVLMSADKEIRSYWQFPRLLYFDRKKYNVSYWMPMLGENTPVLNRGCLFVPAGAVKHLKVTLDEMNQAPLKTGLFIRPDSGLKTFTGVVINTAPSTSWEDVSLLIEKEVHPTDRTMICVSPARQLNPTEWRFWIANRQVAASSPYSWEGQVPWSQPPVEALAVAEAMAANPWQPDLAFVVDVVQTKNDQKFWLNEINAASTSGLYNVPLGDLLPALRKIAMLEASGELEYREE